MSGQLSRLQAFLAGAGELEVVTPDVALRPDYFARFARMMGATVVAAHVAAAAAAAPSAPAPVPAAAAAAAEPLAARDRAATEASILSIKDISARYLAHGRSPLRPQIRMLDPGQDLDEGPAAYVVPGEVCRIDGVRTDYSQTDPRLARMTETPEMRAQVLVHESMHCRIAPALMKALAQSQSPLVLDFARTFNEAAADAMAVLTVARKDGVPAALVALENWYSVRAAEAESPDADGHHDTRETLSRVRNLLITTPGKLDSDGAAFAFAITEALAGASKAFATSLPAEREEGLATPEFNSGMQLFHQAVEQMARDYLDGPHELGAPEISFNNLTLSPGVSAKPSAWQLIAKRLEAPAFKPEDLRKHSEMHATALMAPAGGTRTASLATASATPSPVAPQAIGRLRSRLGAIYVSPVPVGDAPPAEREYLVDDTARPGM